MQARKILFPAILSIIALSSKKISIYNEEIIVVRCFIGFILFSRKSLGQTFKVTLDGRIHPRVVSLGLFLLVLTFSYFGFLLMGGEEFFRGLLIRAGLLSAREVIASILLKRIACSSTLAFILICLLKVFTSCTLFMLPSGGEASSFQEDSFEMGVLLEPFPETSSESWTRLLMGSSSEETNNPSVNQMPADAVAPGGPGEEAASPIRITPYPYELDQIIGGDSVHSIERRLLAQYPPCPSVATLNFTEAQAKELFEVKVEIIRWMAANDPDGDWEGRGARALDNPRTKTGEQPYERLIDLLNELQQHGVNSQTFHSLKSKVFSKREKILDEYSEA